VRLYLNEVTNINQVNFVRGRAYVDPEHACTQFGACGVDTTRAVHGNWRLLKPGADLDYEILSDVYGPFFKVIRLHSALTGIQQSLAVTYAYSHVVSGPSGFVSAGDSVRVGGLFEPVDGGAAMTMKLIHAPEGEPALDPGTGVYVAAPFDATRELEPTNC